jgi:V8-like Glu-specific endopeptidase
MRSLLAPIAAAALLLGAAGAAEARNVPHQNVESPSKVRAYWTAERMRAAVPVDRVKGAGPPRENAKPGGGGGGGTSPATSVEVTIPPGSPLTAHGKVFFSDGGANYVCSGTALEGNVVWTAGHCVNEGPGGYYTNFMFVPAYIDGAAPLGKFPASTLLTTGGWRLTGQFGVDVGAAIPSTNATGQTLDQAVVERTPVFNSSRAQSYSAYGYPAARPFNGRRMRVCNTAWSRNDTSATPDTMGVPCDMTGGSSGGGWVTSSGQVASVVSYGYASLKNVLFGPHLEVEAQGLYNDALAASPG